MFTLSILCLPACFPPREAVNLGWLNNLKSWANLQIFFFFLPPPRRGQEKKQTEELMMRKGGSRVTSGTPHPPLDYKCGMCAWNKSSPDWLGRAVAEEKIARSLLALIMAPAKKVRNRRANSNAESRRMSCFARSLVAHPALFVQLQLRASDLQSNARSHPSRLTQCTLSISSPKEIK